MKPAIDCNVQKYALSPPSLCMISINGLFPRFPRNIPITIPKLQFKNFRSSVGLASLVTILEVNERISQHKVVVTTCTITFNVKNPTALNNWF